MADTEGTNGSGGGGTVEVELFVKAGKNGESLGGCPVCQRFFMVLLTKAEYHPEMSLIVTTVNPAKHLPDVLRSQSTTRLPVLRYGDEIISEPEEIGQYIDRLFHYPPMTYDNKNAARAGRDVFQKFSFYVKDVSHSKESLVAELRRLDDYLVESAHRFLCRDLLDDLDCILLPKLHIIRVVSKALKDVEIPEQFKGLWRYLSAAYDTPAFRNSCPSDQEIVDYWQSKPECPTLSKAAAAYYNPDDGPPRYSFGVPDGTPEAPPMKV